MNLIRAKQLKESKGIAPSTLYYWVSNGTFPAPIKLGERTSAWLAQEVEAVIKARVEGKDSEAIKRLIIDLKAKRNGGGV